jgi:hypothetical protein
MFTNGPRSQSNAEYGRQHAGRRVTAAMQYEANAEDWFDGSVDSVDARLAVCDKLLHKARTAVGVGGFGNPAALERIASLETDHKALRDMRADLLVASTWRHSNPTVGIGDSAGVSPGPTPGSIKEPGGPSFTPADNVTYQRGDSDSLLGSGGISEAMGNLGKMLSSRDRRYVELEAAKILRANADCSDVEELCERTRRVAAIDTSTFSPERSRVVTAALTARVAQLATRRQRPKRTASRSPRPPVIEDFPAEFLYF